MGQKKTDTYIACEEGMRRWKPRAPVRTKVGGNGGAPIKQKEKKNRAVGGY